jgi:hypothetical protein
MDGAAPASPGCFFEAAKAVPYTQTAQKRTSALPQYIDSNILWLLSLLYYDTIPIAIQYFNPFLLYFKNKVDL